jgi:hypothetical protein
VRAARKLRQLDAAAPNWPMAETSMTAANDLAVRRALETAGVEFIDENGGGAGVRLQKPRQTPKRK